MKQWVKTKKNEIIKGKNNILDKIIDKSKSFEQQRKSLKKLENLKGFWPYDDFGDKELKFKYSKIEIADMSNEIHKNLFKQIFAHTLETLANKLINTTSKKENQIIVKNINENKEKFYEMNHFYDWVIQTNSQRIDLIDAIKFILDFNEELSYIWFETVKFKNEQVILIGKNSQKLLIILCN